MKINPRVLRWVRRLKRNLLALWFAYRHPDTPFPAKVLAVLVAGYAFSPIDLIPDFLPLVGYLDEFILLPGAIYLAFRLIPKPVLEECQGRADRFLHEHRHTPRNYVAAFVIVLLWAAGLWWLWTEFGDVVVGWIRDALE